MPIDNFKLSGFRGFTLEQEITPAIPSKDKLGLTILVGPNNGGKSSVLESMQFTAQGREFHLSSNQRNASTKFIARFEMLGNSKLTVVESDPLSKETMKFRNTEFPKELLPNRGTVIRRILADPVIFVGPVREHAGKTQNPPDSDWFDHVQKSSPAFERQFHKNSLLGRAAAWDAGDSRFSELLQRITGYDIQVDSENQQLSVRIGNERHGVDTLGLGIISLFHLINAIYDAPDRATILIDEPETGLHPSYQRKVLDTLIEESKRVQIIYSTQSPYMISWDAILNGAVLARVYRSRDGSCKIATLKPQTAQALASASLDNNNPHILGTNALEVFFLQDRIILVEGQEDVVFYRRMAKDIGVDLVGDFYGWGVGGASKMGSVAAVFRDLGFTQVLGILDADKAEECKTLQEQFSEYDFICSPTNDVRDREERRVRPEVRGLCDGKGVIHPDCDSKVRELFNDVNAKLTKR
jgi:predicted ATP-dependent endonuclease of OLD family